MFKKLLLFLFFTLSIQLYSADIFVDQSAAAGGDGSSWALAFQDIQSAVDAALANDTIFIAAGIYQPENEIDITIPLNFRGGYPAGGGIQNTVTNITQIQADFDPGNLLFRIFDIAASSSTTMEGLRFYNTRSAIESRSDIILDQVDFERFSIYAVRISGDIATCAISNAKFSDFSGLGISQTRIITNLNITNTIFQEGTNTAISLSDEVANFVFTDITLRDFNTSDRVISIRDLGNAGTITNLEAFDNNLTTSGSLFLIDNSNVSFSNAAFKNNSGQNGTPCIQTRDGIVAIDASVFEGNSIIGSGPKSVFLIRDTEFTVTNSHFENNHAQGTFSALADIRADNTDALTIFDNCVFRGNSILGSSQQGIIDASYDTNILINNCVFDANSSPGQFVVASFAASGAVVTNSTFMNHSVGPGVLSIDYVEGGTGGGIRVEGNTFTNNVNTTVNLFRMTDFNFENNQFYGEVLIDIDDSGIGTMTNDYFQGNASGSRFMLLEDVNLTLNQVAMISTQQNGNHRLINSDSNTALTVINSTFSATDFNDTNVSIGFNADQLSRVRNSIIWSGNDLSQSGFHGNTSNLQIRNSLVKGENPTGAGNLNGTSAGNAPVFVNPSNLDFRERPCSPTVNAGNNTFNNQTNDFLNNQRIFETTIDMGAYELQQNATGSCGGVARPLCSILQAPVANSTNVPVDTNLSWVPDPDATGYNLLVGTTFGGSDIANVVLGSVTSYNLPNDLPGGTQIFVRIVPFNGIGNAFSCTYENFTTENSPNSLSCTYLTSPANGDTIVPIGTTQMSWNTVADATGYRITITGTANNNVNNAVVTTNNYTFSGAFVNGETATVTIIPFNGTLNANGCISESFTIEALATPTLPSCTTISTPLNNATNISPGTTITWNAVANADGYRITSTSTSGRNLVTDLVLTSNTWDPIQDYDYNDTVTITIVPYNTSGPATGCTAESFTTAGIPACSTLSAPMNLASDVSISTDLTWNSAANATGYRLRVGTTTGGNDILNDFNVGNNLTYDLPNDLPQNTQIYVTIVPYNPIEIAFACIEESFTTETTTTAPLCTSLTSPTGTDVAIGTTQMTWNAVADATGYRITITGTANNNVSDVEVNGTSYTFPNAFQNGETATVTIIPFNGSVNAAGCSSETFTIETAAPTGNAFITTWQTTTTNEAITIPTTGGGYNYTVDWGDGNITTGENGNATHTYTNPGIYTVSITGDFPRIFFNTNGNPTPADNSSKILTIEQWGDNLWTSMESAFTGCINLTGNFADTPDLSNVTSTMGMFATCRLFNSNIDNWNVSSVTNMAFMFQNNASFNQPLNSWDVSNVDNMFIMFQGARIFDQPLDNWNVENVTNADRMLDQVSLSTANYDALLIAWNAQNLQPDVLFSGGDSQYCEGASARANMIASDGWVISDDGIAGPTVADLANQTHADSFTLPTITGTQLTGGEAYYSDTNGVGTSYNAGDTINFTDFPNYPVNIYIYDGSGSCASEESFELTLTSTTPVIPACTSLTSPTGNNVAIGTTQMTWNAVADATGYRITITGTANNNVSDVEVTANSYTFTGAFVNGETATVTIIPFNGSVNAAGCSSETFTIEAATTPTAPACSSLTSPTGTDVAIGTTQMTWNAVADATGYRITITGTANNNVSDVEVTANSYTFTGAFVNGETATVTIIPFNGTINATGCASESFTIEAATPPTVPECTNLISPTGTDVAIGTTQMTWDAVTDATGYRITITGTANNDITEVEISGTSYTFPGAFVNGETATVTIIPFNGPINATGCASESFTIETTTPPTVPECTNLISPTGTDVAIGTTQMTWDAVTGATGYRITITGTANNDITEVEISGTSYTFLGAFVNGETATVTIIPFNGPINASGCASESFTIETTTPPTVPECTNLISPTGTDVAIGTTQMTWDAVTGATGYRITITGTANNDITEVEISGTSYTFPGAFVNGETATVTIIPFNGPINASGCASESFTIEAATPPTVPECTNLISPTGTDVAIGTTQMTWDAVTGATGYRITITGTANNDITEVEISGTSYTFPGAFVNGETATVTIIPFNGPINASGCASESFTIEAATPPTVPECTSLIMPNNGDINIELSTSISWEEVANVEGYRLSIGTIPGGTDILDDEDVGIITSFSLTENLIPNTTYFVRITPYNTNDNAADCEEYSFSTIRQDETLYGLSPNGDGINDFWAIDGIEASPENTVFIFNRWGDMVFQIQGYDNQSNVFNGNANKKLQMGASELPSGTYFFKIQVSGEHSLNKLQGFLVLKR